VSINHPDKDSTIQGAIKLATTLSSLKTTRLMANEIKRLTLDGYGPFFAVDDESKPERRPSKHMRTPEEWDVPHNPVRRDTFYETMLCHNAMRSYEIP